jgi:hypothetical protein
MAKSNQDRLKRLNSLSSEEAWKEILREATVGTEVDPEEFLKSISPLPDFKNRSEVLNWLDLVLSKIDRGMSVTEAKVLRTCCDTLTSLFKMAGAK